jgi:hypothetical protein
LRTTFLLFLSTLLPVAAARATWTDSRLDDLKETVLVIDEKVTALDVNIDKGFARQDANVDRLDAKIDNGFARLDGRIDSGFARMDGRVDEINDRIDKLNHVLVQAMIGLISVIAVLLSALVAIGAANL